MKFQADVVGSVEGGIMGAAWSPDDTLLVLVTGRVVSIEWSARNLTG